jgi:hypothetical protein
MAILEYLMGLWTSAHTSTKGLNISICFALAGLHGSITPSGVIRTNQGANVSFVIQPDAYIPCSEYPNQ